jgi:hypothetical protein
MKTEMSMLCIVALSNTMSTAQDGRPFKSYEFLTRYLFAVAKVVCPDTKEGLKTSNSPPSLGLRSDLTYEYVASNFI